MNRKPLMYLTLLAAVGSSQASGAVARAATRNPNYAHCGKHEGGKFTDSSCKNKGAGEFEIEFIPKPQEISVSANGKQIIKGATGNPIVCGSLKAAKGANIKFGSEETPGTGEGTLEYGECEVEKSPKCEINKTAAGKAKITSNALKTKLAFETKTGAENSEKELVPTVTVLEAASGKVLAELELSGEGCPVTGKTKIEGSVVMKNLKGEELSEMHESEAPEAAITKYFVNNEGKATEEKAELKAFGTKATVTGKARWKLLLDLFVIVVLVVFLL